MSAENFNIELQKTCRRLAAHLSAYHQWCRHATNATISPGSEDDLRSAKALLRKIKKSNSHTL